MADIQKLLRKRKLTGREAGQLELANIGDLYRRAIAGDYSGPPLVDRMEERLETLSDEAYSTYQNYAAIGRWIRSRPAIANGHRITIRSNADILTLLVLEATTAEDIYRFNVLYHGNPDIFDAIKSFSLEAYLEAEPVKPVDIDHVRELRSEIRTSYYYLQGMNTQIDLTIDRTGVQELAAFKMDLKPLEEKIERYNGVAAALRENITYRNTSQKTDLKLKLADQVFPPLDYSELKTPDYLVKEAKALVYNFSAFRADQVIFSNMMCFRSEEEGGIGA